MSLDYAAGTSRISPSAPPGRSRKAIASARPASRNSSGWACICATAQGKLIRVDDPKLDPVWQRCGELSMPVSIHVADPKAFWLPYDDRNERWKELKDHKSWWFGDTQQVPAVEGTA